MYERDADGETLARRMERWCRLQRSDGAFRHTNTQRQTKDRQSPLQTSLQPASVSGFHSNIYISHSDLFFPLRLQVESVLLCFYNLTLSLCFSLGGFYQNHPCLIVLLKAFQAHSKCLCHAPGFKPQTQNQQKVGRQFASVPSLNPACGPFTSCPPSLSHSFLLNPLSFSL